MAASRGVVVIPEGAPQVKRRRLEESARSGVLPGTTTCVCDAPRTRGPCYCQRVREGGQGRPQAPGGAALTARATPRAPLMRKPGRASWERLCSIAPGSSPWSGSGRSWPSPGPEVSRGRQRRSSSGAGHPFAAPVRAAWSGAAAARRTQSRGRPRLAGVMTNRECAPWLRPSWLTPPSRSGSGSPRRASRSRRG